MKDEDLKVEETEVSHTLDGIVVYLQQNKKRRRWKGNSVTLNYEE